MWPSSTNYHQTGRYLSENLQEKATAKYINNNNDFQPSCLLNICRYNLTKLIIHMFLSIPTVSWYTEQFKWQQNKMLGFTMWGIQQFARGVSHNIHSRTESQSKQWDKNRRLWSRWKDIHYAIQNISIKI